MPSKSKAQARLMAAVAHGWKPDRIKGPPVKVAKEFNAADSRRGSGALRKAAGGPIGSALTGRPLPRPGAGSNGGRGGLGSSGIVGALGSSLTARTPLAAKRSSRRGALSGPAASGVGSSSNRPIRPVPGRGVNPYLSRSGQYLTDAEDRLTRLGRSSTPRR